jgi:hypothetical protein
MPKASNRFSLPAAHRNLMQNVLVDLVRAAIQQGVSQAKLGAELMAQGYAMLTAKDMSEARSAVFGMIERGRKREGTVGTSSKDAVAKKSQEKRSKAKNRRAKKSTARRHGTKAMRR